MAHCRNFLIIFQQILFIKSKLYDEVVTGKHSKYKFLLSKIIYLGQIALVELVRQRALD
jgi:hypothetical protein